MNAKNLATTGISLNDQLLLEKCRTIELLNKELYDRFAETYFDNPEAVYLWRKTASEEENHAEQFSLALKLKKGLLLENSLSIEKADKLIENLNAVIIRVIETPFSLLDALEFAIKIENYLTNFHLSCIATFKDKSFEMLFKAMMNSDQQHIAAIEAFYENLAAKSAANSTDKKK